MQCLELTVLDNDSSEQSPNPASSAREKFHPAIVGMLAVQFRNLRFGRKTLTARD